MTTQHTNHAIIVGQLVATRSYGTDRSFVARRNELGAMQRLFTVQSQTAFGSPYEVTLTAANGIPGIELLETAAFGTRLTVEGELRRVKHYDTRFAIDDNDAGLEIRETQLHVSSIRAAHDDEPFATSAVWLRGTIATHPKAVTRNQSQQIALATTLLRVTSVRPSGYPGSRALIHEDVEINVAIPADNDLTPLMCRPGNAVVLEGQLDSVRVMLQGEPVNRKLAQLEARWKAQQEQLATHSETAKRNAFAAYRREREWLSHGIRLTVMTSYVELISGTPRALSEAAAARSTAKQTRAARRV